MPACESHALSLYCDALNQHQRYRKDESFPVVFYNPQARRCRELAKEAGWKFLNDGRVLCPRCAGNQIKLPKRQK